MNSPHPIILTQIQTQNKQPFVSNFFKNLKTSSVEPSLIYASTEENNFMILDSHLNLLLEKPYTNTIYDYHPISGHPSKYVLSCKDDPIRFIDFEKTVHFENLKKPNSEDFLSPISISSIDNNLCFAGKTLLRTYDSQAMRFTTDFLKTHKFLKKDSRQISVCQFLNPNLLALGLFDRQLMLVDIRQNDKPISVTSIHFDAVMSILQLSDSSFFSAARNDDFVYLWVFLRGSQKRQ